MTKEELYRNAPSFTKEQYDWLKAILDIELVGVRTSVHKSDRSVEIGIFNRCRNYLNEDQKEEIKDLNTRFQKS